jgi:hypothetical protein
MYGFQLSTHVSAPIETVFRLAADFAETPGRIKLIKRVEMLTPGPVGVGTRFRETREFMKREATEEMEVTAFDAPRSYTLVCRSHGCLFESHFRFEPDGNGTRMTLACNNQALTLGAKLMSPLAWLMQGTIKKCVEQDLADIKSAAETESPR